MPQNAWNPKRERQYEHIKESLKERGAKEDKAEEIAARTVNKERARSGEARQASRTSIEDISSERRGGDLFGLVFLRAALFEALLDVLVLTLALRVPRVLRHGAPPDRSCFLSIKDRARDATSLTP